MVTLESIKNKSIVIYGTGINAVKCIYFLEKMNIKIEYIIDGKGESGKFKNYQVFQPSDKILDGKYIIVASSENAYEEIKNRLSKYTEFKNYIYYKWLNKKIVFLYGNCHMDIIESYLYSSANFKDDYIIYPSPRICTEKLIDIRVLKYVDIWIHEDIQKENIYGYKFSDEYIRGFISKQAMEIIMPHLYGLGAAFFPHAKGKNERNVALLNGLYENGMFPFRDDIIENAILECKSITDIESYVNFDNIISEKYIVDNFENYIYKIEKREKKWDIKILDFILCHYKSDKLFYDIGHPTNIILKEISRKILEKLEIYDEIVSDKSLDYHEVPIYPYIRKTLGMMWDEKNIRKNSEAIKGTSKMDIQEYIREYIWWCYPELYNKMNKN